MLTPATIIYFDPFYFKNGNKAKPKYFLVLSNNGSRSIVVSLPSSKDFVPSYAKQEFGCVELSAANFNCFIFTPTIKVTECGKSFSLTTYLYGHLLDVYAVEEIEQLYPIEGVDYQVWGKMKKEIFMQVIACFMNSDSVKRKFKREISVGFTNR